MLASSRDDVVDDEAPLRTTIVSQISIVAYARGTITMLLAASEDAVEREPPPRTNLLHGDGRRPRRPSA